MANFFLLNNNPIKFNYVEKLGLKLSEPKIEVKVDDESIEIVDDDLYEALKKYRYEKAKENGLRYNTVNHRIKAGCSLEVACTLKPLKVRERLPR